MRKIHTALALVIAIAPATAPASCGAPEVNRVVKSKHAPWREPAGPGVGIPNGCPGDGITWAVVTWTWKDGKGVDSSLATNCVSADVAARYNVGDRFSS